MSTSRRQWLVLVALMVLVSASAKAETLTFSVQSLYPNIVDLEFYSQDRNAAWPGGNEVYSLDSDAVVDFPLSCQRDELICYGAWVRGTESVEWGSGKNGTLDCQQCCYVCDGGESETIILE